MTQHYSTQQPASLVQSQVLLLEEWSPLTSEDTTLSNPIDFSSLLEWWQFYQLCQFHSLTRLISLTSSGSCSFSVASCFHKWQASCSTPLNKAKDHRLTQLLPSATAWLATCQPRPSTEWFHPLSTTLIPRFQWPVCCTLLSFQLLSWSWESTLSLIRKAIQSQLLINSKLVLERPETTTPVTKN